MTLQLAELVASAGLDPLEGDDLNGAPTEIFYVSATPGGALTG